MKQGSYSEIGMTELRSVLIRRKRSCMSFRARVVRKESNVWGVKQACKAVKAGL